MSENLRPYNDARSTEKLLLIEPELRLLRKSKAQFKSIGRLAQALEDRTGVHRTTLTNEKGPYRKLLADYQRATGGGVRATFSNAVESAQVALLQADLGKERLERKKREAALAQVDASRSASSSSNVDKVGFANACVLLCDVLARIETIAVDMARGELIDLSVGTNRVLADGPRTAQFIDWLRKGNHPAAARVPRA